MGQMVGLFAPAGELALTAAAMFGSPAPDPVGLGKDQGGPINGLPRSGGTIGVGLADMGVPTVTGGASPSSGGATVQNMPTAGISSLLDLSHPAPWMLLLALGLLGLIHFNVGGATSVRVGK